MTYFPQAADDILLLHTLATQHWLEVEDDEETFDRLLAAKVLVIGSGGDHACQRRPVLGWLPANET